MISSGPQVGDEAPLGSDHQDGWYWGEIDRDKMRKLNQAADERGWRQALAETAPELLEYAEDDRRADWMTLLPVEDHWVVLDVGAGLGGLSFVLARRVREVVALEPVGERAQFIESRRRQENVEQMKVVRGDLNRPGMPNGAFDLVVLNGVLEWVGLSETGNPGDIQRATLRRVHAVLREGGWIYVGIENRVGIPEILGARDHSGLRFTSLMPRVVADRYVRERASKHYRTFSRLRGYRTYTYTYWGYRQLLRECGFDQVRMFGTLAYNSPTVIYELERGTGFRWWARQATARSSVTRAIQMCVATACPVTLIKLLSPCFLIVARKV